MAKKLKKLSAPFKEGHNKPGEGKSNHRNGSVGHEQLGVFKGTRAGAKRKGDTHFHGYPDVSKSGNGHPGAHQA